MAVIDDDWHVNGHLSGNTMSVANGSVSNASVAATASIASSKLNHVFRAPYAQPNTAGTSETRVVHVCRGAGTLLSFVAGSIAAATGDATVTLDLRKNGTTVLSAVITLDSGNSNRVVEAATLVDTTLAAGDVLEVVTVATIGTGTLPTGVFAAANLTEAYTA